MPGIRHPLMINGVPVVTAPAEMDVNTAEQLRVVLRGSAARGHSRVVVDMTRTRFCDSAGLTVLIWAHKRALAEGGGLRLVIPADGAVARIFAITRLDRIIPLFGSLDEALTLRPAAMTLPLRPPPSAGQRPAPSPRSPGRRM